jgi:hypothetical protein
MSWDWIWYVYIISGNAVCFFIFTWKHFILVGLLVCSLFHNRMQVKWKDMATKTSMIQASATDHFKYENAADLTKLQAKLLKFALTLKVAIRNCVNLKFPELAKVMHWDPAAADLCSKVMDSCFIPKPLVKVLGKSMAGELDEYVKSFKKFINACLGAQTELKNLYTDRDTNFFGQEFMSFYNAAVGPGREPTDANNKDDACVSDIKMFNPGQAIDNMNGVVAQLSNKIQETLVAQLGVAVESAPGFAAMVADRRALIAPVLLLLA